jgi:GNAT superfamily N-acetyltransferase
VTQVRDLQERAARALPAEHVEHADGWWLRRAPGCGWWVGTVLPHRDGDLAHRVRNAERFYAGHGATARFQICPGACPPDLDALLDARGYERGSPVSLQTGATATVLDRLPADALRVEVDDHPPGGWFDAWHAVHGGDPVAEWNLLARVTRPSGYARVIVGNEIVAVGRAVVDTGWAGIFGMATLPRARGKGAARAVLGGLARWALGHRAYRMYLQVERDNVAALRLYEQADFTELCGYHYRARSRA